MTLASLGVNGSQRWRLASGMIPGCPVGTVVTLTTSGHRLDVTRAWFGVVAQLDLRIATINATSDGHELVLGTAGGEVVFENEAGPPVAPAGSLAQPQVGSFVGQLVQFGGTGRNADGWNVFVFLVLRRVNGWVLGLTQAGHPAGIAEDNIAWARVLDPGPHLAPDRLVLTYKGKRKDCNQAFAAEEPTFRELGYELTSESFWQEPRNTATVVFALLLGVLLALVLIGLAILVWLVVTKPPGLLTVTLHRTQAIPAPLPSPLPSPVPTQAAG
jgi:hypothetical protein